VINVSVNLERYRVFYHAAQAGSLSRAAKELYLSQPAVSQAVKQLESDVGCPLFVRMARGVRLTEEGKVLFSYIAQAYRLIEAGERKLVELRRLERGEVRIGASDTLCRYVLLPYLEAFHAAYPHIQIHVTNRTSGETAELLMEGRIDFGIVTLPLLHERIVVHEGVFLQNCFVVGERRKALAARPVSVTELAGHPLILLEEGSVNRAGIDAYFQSHGVSVKPEIELGSIDLLVQFAKIGLGVACVVRDFITEELNARTLFEVTVEPPLPRHRIGLITLKDTPLSPAANAFIAALQYDG